MMAKVMRIRELPIFVALLLLLLLTGILNPAFRTGDGLTAILIESALIGFLAVGQSNLIIMRHIDLSVSSTAGLVSFLVGSYSMNHGGVTGGVAILIAIGVGATVGIVNGALVAYLGLPSLVVTIATLYIVRGIFNYLAAGITVTADQLPPYFSWIGSGEILGIPDLFVFAALAAAIMTLVLRYTRWGRDLYSIGSNPQAARRVGIPVPHREFAAFVLNGSIAGIAGLMLLSRFSFADATAGLGIELYVVAACVIGGVAIAGGVGTPAGALIGAVLLQTIAFALGALGVSQFWQQAVAGALLVAAIAFDRIVAMRSTRHATRLVEVPV
ncbi:MAG: ABC transporter permease [Actinomycetes bacterium]